MMPFNLEPNDPDYQDHIWRLWRARELKIELYEQTLDKIAKGAVDVWSVNMAVTTLHRGKSIDGPATERSRRQSWITQTIEIVVRAVVAGFKDDPGTSDLDGEQPIWVGMKLKTWRNAKGVVAELDRGWGEKDGRGKGGAA